MPYRVSGTEVVLRAIPEDIRIHFAHSAIDVALEKGPQFTSFASLSWTPPAVSPARALGQ